jgi:hypothetical protein
MGTGTTRIEETARKRNKRSVALIYTSIAREMHVGGRESGTQKSPKCSIERAMPMFITYAKEGRMKAE